MHILLFNLFKLPSQDYLYISQTLRQRGHKVWLANLNEENVMAWHDGSQVVAETVGPTPINPVINKIPLVRTLVRRVHFFAFLRRIRAFADSCDADIVQFDTGGLFKVWHLPLGKKTGQHYILDIRHINREVRKDPVGRFIEEVIIFSQGISGKYIYDRTFVNHAGTAQTILGDDWPKYADVVPCGIRDDFLKVVLPPPDVSDPAMPVTFIYVGAISKFRELEVMFQAARQVMARTDNFHIKLIGPDIENGYYHQMIETMGIGKVVSIDPQIPNDQVPAAMAGYHVGLAYTPKRKTWDYQPTLKILEYRALGLPILSYDVITHREVVENGVNGLLVEQTVDGLADGMLRFIEDRAFLLSCMENARKMRTAFTMKDAIDRYEQTYRALAMKGSSGRLQETG